MNLFNLRMNQPPEKISIIVAAYNEQGNIGKAIKRVREVLPHAEIIIVNDGSTDQTLQEAQQFENQHTKIISYSPNCGKGYATRKGIEAATGSLMAQIDADLQFPPEGLPSLIQPIIERKADIVFGSRYLNSLVNIEKGSISFIKRLASYVMAGIISFVCGQRYTDVFAGFKAWKSDVIRKLDLQENDFTYEAEIAIKAKKYHYKVIEVPTNYKGRIGGKSKIKVLYHTITIAWRILKLATL